MKCLYIFFPCIFLLFTFLRPAHNLPDSLSEEYVGKKMERLSQKLSQKSQNLQESIQFLQPPTGTKVLEKDKNTDQYQKGVKQNTKQTNIQQNKFFSLYPTSSVKVAQLSTEQFFQKYMKDFQAISNAALGKLVQNNPSPSSGSGLSIVENVTKNQASVKVNSSTQKKQPLPLIQNRISTPSSNRLEKENNLIKLNQSLKQSTIQNSSSKKSSVTQNKVNISTSKNTMTSQTENQITITQKSLVVTSDSDNMTPSKLFDNTDSLFKRKKNEKKEVASKQFEGIGLYSAVPLVFVEGQIYKFDGVVLNPSLVAPQGSVKINFITVIFSDQTGSNQFKCSQEVEANLTFELSCKMQKSGIYYLSIFAGLYGQSTIRPRNILRPSRLPMLSISQPPKPLNVHLEIINNNLYVIWDSMAGLTNLTIYQQNGGQIKSKQYLLSNFHDKFKLPLLDFKQFYPQMTYVELSHAQSSDGSLAFIQSKFGQVFFINFKASQHAFKQYFEDLISTQVELPWRVNVGEKIQFNVSFKDNIKRLGYIVEPDLTIRKLYLSQEKFPMDVIRSGTSLSIQIVFNKQGTNILQINSISGMALINRPIYVGQSYPLLPDYRDEAPLVMIFKSNQLVNSGQVYQDYYKRTTQKINKTQPSVSSSIQQKREYLLTLLNGLRRKHRVDPVELSQELNKIAQLHSDDMAQNNYFSHSSPNGDGPGERAKKMGFTNSIGENIALARYLTEAHLGLQRSAGHLENSVGRGWVRVGIGISRNNNNEYLVCFEFSSRDFKRFPLTPEQEQRIKRDLFKVVKYKNPSIVKQNEQLSSDIEHWMQLGKDSKMLEQILRKNNYNGPIIASSFTFSSTQGWQDRLSQADFLDVKQKFKEIGTGLKTADDTGNLEGVIIFA